MLSSLLQHNPFDQYPLELLEAIRTPSPPEDFHDFWQQAYEGVLTIRPEIRLKDTGKTESSWRIVDVYYTTSNNITLGGWLLIPSNRAPKRGFIVGHGYGGRVGPDFHLPFRDSVVFFPCCRGISRSPAPPISSDPKWHVLHDIDKKDRYVIRGCVEDIWLAVSCIEQLFPHLTGHIGFLGISFTGGVGAIAMAQEKRVSKAHFNVPTFGDHRLRLRIKTWGSGLAIQQFFKNHPRKTLGTLRYYDAASAAEHISMPVHFALALKDPIVTPPGQFAIYNQVQSKKQLFVLDEGHNHYPNEEKQHRELVAELKQFFKDL